MFFRTEMFATIEPYGMYIYDDGVIVGVYSWLNLYGSIRTFSILYAAYTS